MGAFNHHDGSNAGRQAEFERFMRSVLGGRDSLSDLIITERDSATLQAVKRARVAALVNNLRQHISGHG